ncbi:hypothetical protein AAFX60_017290 [Aliivibrio fischeri]
MYDCDSASQNSYYAQFPRLCYGWVYIAIDIRDMGMSKIGLTSIQDPVVRISQGKTYNPFIMPFAAYELSKCTFGVSKEELGDMEANLHSRSGFGKPLQHLSSGRDSEWFYIDPDSAENQMDMYIAKRGFAVDRKYLYTYNSGYEKFGGIVPERMQKIKTIYRPEPQRFYNMAINRGLRFEQFRNYYDYLVNFHDRDDDGKIYL